MSGIEIIVKSDIKPIHSFDLWGTLVIQEVMGPRVIESYARLMGNRSESEEVAANIENYRGVLRGDKAALANKKKIVDAVEASLWRAYEQKELDISFQGAFYEDATYAIERIMSSGESVCILTTGESPWVRQALMSLDPCMEDAIVGRDMKVYSGDKTKPQTYEAVEVKLAARKERMVSHTEDQLKGLAGLLSSEMRNRVNIIYVERANLATPEEASAAGVHRYVKDLREIDYPYMVR